MNNEVYKEVYGHILNDAQRIRKEIMNEWGDILMFGGSMPDDVVGELSTAARITGLAFDALSSHGVKCSPVNGKPDLFTLTVREESYICHKSAIPSMSGFLDVVNIPGVSTPSSSEQSVVNPKVEDETVGEKFVAPLKQERQEEQKTEEVNPWDDEDFGNDTVDENLVEEEFENKSINDADDASDNIVSDEEVVETENIIEEAENEIVNEDVEDDFQSFADEVDKSSEEEKTDDYENDSAVSVSNVPNIGSFSKSDMFIEETEKAENEIVYEMFGVTMTHSGFSGGGKSLDAQIMIAPLKIQKFSCPSVPIIVSVYYKGKIITSSSYDQAEEGKNLVTLNIDEFYLLFRGSYDGNGKFRAFITTTGISASQGDILNIVSESRHGDDAGRNVNNGHVKFRATVYDDPGTIEVFPFGEPEDNEFIVMTKTDEFVDYMYISNDAGGLKKAVIFQNGNKVQVGCEWIDDKMSVTLKEV